MLAIFQADGDGPFRPRSQVLAALGPPVRPLPPLRVVARPLPMPVPVEESPAPSLTRLVAARLVSLGLIFVLATVTTLALSLVAHALRTP